MLSMVALVFYYLVAPFLMFGLLLKLMRKYGKIEIAPDIRALCEQKPIQKKWFRTVRRDHKGLRFLGDFETHGEAVDCAYGARKEAAAQGEPAAFLVLNAKAETLEEVDS